MVKSLQTNQGIPPGIIYVGINQNGVFFLKRKEKKCPRFKDAILVLEIGELKSWRYTPTTFMIRAADVASKDTVRGRSADQAREFTFKTAQGKEMCALISLYAQNMLIAFENELKAKSS
eukprot:TRINITY_DN3263_c0_g1::TRINITY_DN3263_c0_g1_i1::g.29767::m.29767 TRINITY_DN3263_c0_g1::TRINITY_DN3263_c0_g1_i1::g.29767  ORF type:complete len:126 (-),score=57.52 TRINITY_DN3263_c0_g1_i1:475-831(-)